MNKCLNCKEPVSDAATFCSDKCRMSYRRRTKKGAVPEQPEQEKTTRTFDFALTRTDKLFEAAKPGYYNFGQKVYERECRALGCNNKFKTRLEMLQTCSPTHMREVLDSLTV